MNDEEEEDYFLPLEDQRVFGAGVKRKRIAFVPSSSQEPVSVPRATTRSTHDRYLSIVLKQPTQKTTNNTEEVFPPPTKENSTEHQQESLCPICHLPVANRDSLAATSNKVLHKASHESSIAHQLCLTHSHPPSHLDRGHVGLKYLSNYGWDPDARLGLGAAGEGIRAPIKGKVKADTSGLGVDAKDEDGLRTQKAKEKRKQAPIVRLNAKQVRQQELEGKKREARLRDAFYGKDLEQYLGPEG